MKIELCDLCEKNSPDAKIKYKYKAKLFWWTWYKGGWKEIELCQGCLDKIIKRSKTGKWIKKMVRENEELYCSNCGNGIDVIYEYSFCPNCGAKMSESEVEE